jgi:hypothetical protein
MNASQLINQDSGDFEYYTPPAILAAARLALGTIDLDPASSSQANKFVEARQFFSEADNGLAQLWYGHVWLNHPFSRNGNRQWIQKLIYEHKSGRVTEACCITYAATSESWFRPLLSFPQCFLVPRTNYLLPNGLVKTGVTKGSVVTYLGPNLDSFTAAFSRLGVVKVAP